MLKLVAIGVVSIIAVVNEVLATDNIESKIIPVTTLIGLTGLIIKYVRDYRVEKEQKEYFEHIIIHQKDYYETLIKTLREEIQDLKEELKDLKFELKKRK